MVDQRKVFSLFPAGIIVRDSHPCQSPACHEQDMDLRRTRSQASGQLLDVWFYDNGLVFDPEK